MYSLDGGTKAPAPRNRRRRKASPRIAKIMQARMPSGGPQGPALSRSVEAMKSAHARVPQKPIAKLGQAGIPGLGHQLTRRVQSGAIDQEQAQKVSQDRNLLRDTYGADWRRDVYGDRGYMQRTRMGLQENPDDPQIQALMANLQERRQKMLDRARTMKKRKQVDDNFNPDDVTYL